MSDDKLVARVTKAIGSVQVLTVEQMRAGQTIHEVQAAAVVAALQSERASMEGEIERLRRLVEESLFHLRLDRAAESYHHRALAALNPTGKADVQYTADGKMTAPGWPK
jgi:hypothetical protein